MATPKPTFAQVMQANFVVLMLSILGVQLSLAQVSLKRDEHPRDRHRGTLCNSRKATVSHKGLSQGLLRLKTAAKFSLILNKTLKASGLFKGALAMPISVKPLKSWLVCSAIGTS